MFSISTDNLATHRNLINLTDEEVMNNKTVGAHVIAAEMKRRSGFNIMNTECAMNETRLALFEAAWPKTPLEVDWFYNYIEDEDGRLCSRILRRLRA